MSDTLQSHTHPLCTIAANNCRAPLWQCLPVPPVQGLRAIDPPTSAKGQPAAALVLPASTDQDWDKGVSDLLAAQDGPSLKGFKDLLSAFDGRLTPAIRRALMYLIRHWYQGCGTMNVTQADIRKILPDGDELRGLVIRGRQNCKLLQLLRVF